MGKYKNQQINMMNILEIAIKHEKKYQILPLNTRKNYGNYSYILEKYKKLQL